MIYVLCPAAFKTGGTELLHQLVYQLNYGKNKKVAKIVYFGDIRKPRIMAFDKYIAGDWITEEDVPEDMSNIFVIPETALSKFAKFKYGKKIIWWLSVDNFYNDGFNGYSDFINIFRKKGIYHAVGGILKGKVKNRKKILNQANLHLYQSEYAKDFLKKNQIPDKKVRRLSDYINDVYILGSDAAICHEKKDIVLFNPKKGLKFTKQIMSASPKWIKWVPLINMSNEEVYNHLISGKVYIDFGNHPGKDRFPREAAISGCCIITDKIGAAKYYKDIPIPDKYKFDKQKNQIPDILNKIIYCLRNYKKATADFETYRKIIRLEKKEFKRDCESVFDVEKK